MVSTEVQPCRSRMTDVKIKVSPKSSFLWHAPENSAGEAQKGAAPLHLWPQWRVQALLFALMYSSASGPLSNCGANDSLISTYSEVLSLARTYPPDRPRRLCLNSLIDVCVGASGWQMSFEHANGGGQSHMCARGISSSKSCIVHLDRREWLSYSTREAHGTSEKERR
jgi:hypothetical protein